MLIFPISTDRHDGNVGITSLCIIGLCLLFHIFVSIDQGTTEKRVAAAVEQYRQLELSKVDSTSYFGQSLEDLVDVMTRTADTSNVYVKMRHGADSVAAVVRENSLLYRFGFRPAHFNLFTLFSSTFLHGGWLHLIGNMIFFYVCGVAMEKYWGHIRFLMIYLGCGAGASLFYMLGCLLNWDKSATIPLIGASGAIAGAMGAFVATHFRAKVKIFYMLGITYRGTFSLPAWLYFGFWFVSQIFFWLLDTGHEGGVAYLAHIGGFVLGVGFGKLVKSEEEESLLQPSTIVRPAAVIPDGIIGRGRDRYADIDDMESMPTVAVTAASLKLAALGAQRDLSPTERAVHQAQLARPQHETFGVAQSETRGWDLLARGDRSGAERELGQAVASYLQTPLDKKEDINQLFTRIFKQNPPLNFPATQLYQWAKQLYEIQLPALALACLDRGAADTSNAHTQKNCLLTAAKIRIQQRVQPEKARQDLQKIIALEPAGIFNNQARELLQKTGSTGQ